MSSFGRNDLSDPSLRAAVARLLRRKLPAQEVDDAVQTVLTEAYAAPEIPDSREAASRWLLGIARHKAVDFFRKRRELPTDEVPTVAVQMDHEERDFVRFMLADVAGEQAPLVDVLLREADGEKLEQLAAEVGVAAPTLRQRVSRLRRFLREKRALELALVAAALVALAIAFGRFRASGKPKLLPDIVAPQVDPPMAKARELRDRADRSCGNQAWQECLDQLDDAKKLDPGGDGAERSKSLREKATRELNPTVPETQKADPDARAPVRKKDDFSREFTKPPARIVNPPKEPPVDPAPVEAKPPAKMEAPEQKRPNKKGAKDRTTREPSPVSSQNAFPESTDPKFGPSTGALPTADESATKAEPPMPKKRGKGGK